MIGKTKGNLTRPDEGGDFLNIYCDYTMSLESFDRLA